MTTVALFAYSRRGCETARRIRACFPEDSVRAYTMEKFGEPDFSPLEKPAQPFYGKLFRETDLMIFVGACGIAVREIAPHVRDKKTDPAVLSVDELGQFVIPLLSGHIGGANGFARELAENLGATAVVTTATDINHRFSVDDWAARNGFAIDSMPAAKAVSAAILERDVPLCSDFPIRGSLPSGVTAGESGPLGIALTYRTGEPFGETLRLIPPVLHLGIGCRKGIAQEAVTAAVEQVLAEHHIDKRAVKSCASIDLKANETGLLGACAAWGWPITFYAAEELQKLEGDFTPSSFVKSITGVENVCERSALMGADRLLVKKTAISGVTVAVATENLEVYFG